MKVLSQARRICGYQLRILRGNYKLYLIPVCLFVYMLNELIPIRDFLFSVNEKASPFLLPFIFNDADCIYICSCYAVFYRCTIL